MLTRKLKNRGLLLAKLKSSIRMFYGFVTRLTRRVPLVEKELHTLKEHLCSSPVFSGVYVTQSLVLCVMFCRSLFVPLLFFFWPLCWSVLRFTDSDYRFSIFKLFLIYTLFFSQYDHILHCQMWDNK